MHTTGRFTVFMTGMAITFLLSCSPRQPVDFRPEVVHTTASGVTIVWQSPGKYTGTLFFRPVASDESPGIKKERRPVTNHEIVLDGLAPGTQYIYRLKGTETNYQFRTQPSGTEPFSFLFSWGKMTGSLPELYRNELPDFIFSLTPFTRQDEQSLSRVRPFIPVFDTGGISSPVLEMSGEQRHTGTTWRLDWGGFGFIILDDVSSLTEHLVPLQAYAIGLFPLKTTSFQSTIGTGQSGLHSLLVSHNETYPAHKAAFVIIPGSRIRQTTLDSITYLEVPLQTADPGYMRIEVEIESIRAVYEGMEIVLKSPPLKEKRTCEECRRLADQGAYEKSIQAYKSFIENNKDHFQIDDAYYAIAEIFDTKLFDFPRALEYYALLIEEYKDSALASIAQQRVHYIMQYSEYDFRPLAEFEQIRQVEYARKKDDPLQRAELFSRIALFPAKYPQSKLLPVINYWYANQLKEYDVKKAVAQYLLLAKNYPESDYAREVYWEVGQAYYNAGYYNDAINAFKEVLILQPERKEEINAQIKRCTRNITRSYLAIIAVTLLFTMVCTGVFTPPPGIKRIILGQSLVVLIAGTGCFFILGWFIYEQFTSIIEYMLLAGGMGGSVTFSFLFARTIAVKVIKHAKAGIALLGIIFSLLSLTCTMYLLLYLVNQHYLIIFTL
ncbi:MAG: hypothetical protein JXB88_15440 [Spirochaetales bacterium]|nr:hypothetical protein [Spirochaetales bacterium]